MYICSNNTHKSLKDSFLQKYTWKKSSFGTENNLFALPFSVFSMLLLKTLHVWIRSLSFPLSPSWREMGVLYYNINKQTKKDFWKAS